MNARRFLAIAELVCGAHARTTTFEPLVADWQREWLAAHGPVRRAGIAMRGAAAFATSLALRLDTRDVLQAHGTAIGWLALPLFTALGAVLYVQPITVRLWIWPPVTDMAPLSVLVWYVPMMAAYGVVFAILPVCLALAASDCGVRRAACAGAFAIAAFIAVDGWAVPRMVEMRLRHQFGERMLQANRFSRMTTADFIRQAVDANPAVATQARSTLVAQAREPMLMFSLGVIGAAIGRSRTLAGRAIGVRTLLGYWSFGYGAVTLLGLFAGLLGYYQALRPYAPSTWLPPLSLAAVGITAWLAVRQQERRMTETQSEGIA